MIRYDSEILQPDGQFESSVQEDDEEEEDDEGLSGGEIIIIVVVVVAGLVIVTLIVVSCMPKHSNNVTCMPNSHNALLM